MRFVFLLALLTSFVPALARKPVYQRKINHLLGDIAYIDSKKSIAFTFWIQLVNEPVASQFNKLFKQRDRPMTILIPDNAAWDTYLRDLGRNTTDIESFSDPAMRALFTELYPFFFFEGALDTSDVADGETIILDSWKKSPVGDWPLSIAFRRNTSLGPTGADLEAGTASPYNGTFVSSPYGSGNVEIPNYATDNGCLAQVVPYMPTVPKNLSITIADLGVVVWSEIIKRVPAAASLEISRNFTLLLPPSAAIVSALARSDADLAAFLNAHLVPDRIILSAGEQAFRTSAGVTVATVDSTVSAGDVHATVTVQDVLTNGIVVQVLDRALTAV